MSPSDVGPIEHAWLCAVRVLVLLDLRGITESFYLYLAELAGRLLVWSDYIALQGRS